MSTIYDARKPLTLTGRSIMLDTNIWMLIEAFGNDHKKNLQGYYSEALSYIRKSDCTLATNDYVLSEFFNAACKIEYNIQKDSCEDKKSFLGFKRYRQENADFREFMITVRDTCTMILEDCEYQCVSTKHDITEIIKEAATGNIDFSDVVLREHCREMGYVVMTHDADYVGCGLDIITANPKLL